MADIKLFNRGKRTIQGVHSDKIDETTGKPTPYAFGPEQSGAFSEDEANKLRRMYPNEVVSIEDITRQFNEKPAGAPTAGFVSVTDVQAMVNQAVADAVAKERERSQAEALLVKLPSGETSNLAGQETLPQPAAPTGLMAMAKKLIG